MNTVIAVTTVDGPQGKWTVSTIRTIAGGAGDTQPLGSPFKASDYVGQTPWPFETMVFKEPGAVGFYHRAYSSKAAALVGHAEIVALCESGALPVGHGVRGPFGVPSLTPEEWVASGS